MQVILIKIFKIDANNYFLTEVRNLKNSNRLRKVDPKNKNETFL